MKTDTTNLECFGGPLDGMCFPARILHGERQHFMYKCLHDDDLRHWYVLDNVRHRWVYAGICEAEDEI